MEYSRYLACTAGAYKKSVKKIDVLCWQVPRDLFEPK